MSGVRELRARIKSVGNIKQITRAMEMVATTKLRRFQDRAIASRPYSREIARLVQHLVAVLEGELEGRPLFQLRPEGPGTKIAVLLVSSDRGLCGAYNSNLFRALETAIASHPEQELEFFVYGRRGYQYLMRRNRTVRRLLVDPELEKVDYRSAARAARTASEAFLSGEFARVRVLYTAFESMTRTVPTWIDLLPIRPAELAASSAPADPEGGGAAPAGNARASDVILEPDAETIFERLIPRYLATRLYNALMEAITSEYAMRRVSMKNATDAARDMQKELRSLYNRKRQETITKELLDIVGGAEALR